MIKEYRLRRLNERLASYKAKYAELVKSISLLTGTSSYYIDKQIEYAGIIAKLEFRINSIIDN